GALCSGIIGVLCAGMAVPENQSENQPNPKQPLQTGVLCPGIGGAYWSGIVVYFGAEYPGHWNLLRFQLKFGHIIFAIRYRGFPYATVYFGIFRNSNAYIHSLLVLRC